MLIRSQDKTALVKFENIVINLKLPDSLNVICWSLQDAQRNGGYLILGKKRWNGKFTKVSLGNEEINKRFEADCIKDAEEHEQFAEWLEELKSYKEAEEQGLLVRLPVKIGDDIYRITSKANYDLNVLNGYKVNNRVYHQKVYSIVFSQSGWLVQCDKDSIYAPNVICVDVEYGKTWFLTREEAEKKLEEMKK